LLVSMLFVGCKVVCWLPCCCFFSAKDQNGSD
jgi:hypothetical protein